MLFEGLFEWRYWVISVDWRPVMISQMTLVLFCRGCSEHGSNTEEFSFAWTEFNNLHSENRETHIIYIILYYMYSGYGKYSDPLKFFTLCYIAAIC